MNDLIPLILMWALSKRNCAAPAWPSSVDPPPPMPPLPLPAPAAKKRKKPAPQSSQTFPIQDELLKDAGPPDHPSAPTLEELQNLPKTDVRDAGPDRERRINQIFDKPSVIVPGPTEREFRAMVPKTAMDKYMKSKKLDPSMKNVPVSSIQAILIRNKFPIKRDGLYGPKTEQAWVQLAKRKKTFGTITRVDARTARVPADSYTVMSLP